MTSLFYSLDPVADLLGHHVKTIRRYVQEGRLKAKRIGKQYRITRADLEAFAGGAGALEAPPVARTRRALASTILDVDAVRPEEAQRVSTMMLAGLNARKGEPDFPRVDTLYYEDQARLRITITTTPQLTCDLLTMITTLLEDGRERAL
jgi:excisionase family DNA binding protein